jgi:hypothetical protein
MRKQFLIQYEKVESILVKQTHKHPIDLFLDLKDILEIEDIISEIALDIADLVSEWSIPKGRILSGYLINEENIITLDKPIKIKKEGVIYPGQLPHPKGYTRRVLVD